MTDHYKLAIIGGGCAGLSLASALIREGFGESVLIVEPRRAYEHDRTWCFWDKTDHGHSDLVTKRWSKWSISTPDHAARHEGHALCYQQIRSIDFYTAMLERIKHADNIQLCLGSKAHAVTELTHSVRIETTAGTFSADFAIDTRPPVLEAHSAHVWQVFSGGEVRTNTPCFDPESAGLMTQMNSNADGLKFLYVLPQTECQALIQTTLFSVRKIDPISLDGTFMEDIKTLIDGPSEVLRWERGVLPMGLKDTAQPTIGRVVKAGLAGGALRPSSGYAFTRIQAWADRAARRLSHGSVLNAPKYGSAFQDGMDSVFLKAFTRTPSVTDAWFMRIAERLKGDEFARFMSQSPDARLWLKTVAALPKLPFLTAIASGQANGRKSPNLAEVEA